jgi:hypothetical protein
VRLGRAFLLAPVAVVATACGGAAATLPPVPTAGFMRANCVMDLTVSGAVEGKASYWAFGQFHDVLGLTIHIAVDGAEPHTAIFVNADQDTGDVDILAMAEGVTIEEYVWQPPLANATQFTPEPASHVEMDATEGTATFDVTGTSEAGETLGLDGTADCEGLPVDESLLPSFAP